MNGKRQSLPMPLTVRRPYFIGHYLELLKLHLCLYVALSGVLGHVAASEQFRSTSLAVGGFIGLLACGAAVLNNIQDRQVDACFKRTCRRSLPAGTVPVSHAVILSVCLITAGISGLWAGFGPAPAAWGAAALICYNAVYTPLKKKTLFAVLPGSLSGMVVPAAGWAAAGRPVNDPVIYAVMTVFGLWQIAHFFIIVLKNENSRLIRDPQGAPPDFFVRFSKKEIRLQALIWTTLYVLAMMLFLLSDPGVNSGAVMMLFFNALVSWGLISILLMFAKTSMMPAFTGINLSILIFMGVTICDKFI